MSRLVTERQREVLVHVAFGARFREIAAEMGICSTNGVADHIKALVRKGMLKPSAKKGATDRYELTDAGFIAAGVQPCGHCNGSGVV